MKINTNSWHYRVVTYIDDRPSRTLCSYVSKLIAIFVFAPIVFPTLAFLYCTFWVADLFSGEDSGIIVSYVKAKKAKVCPIIEYVDE